MQQKRKRLERSVRRRRKPAPKAVGGLAPLVLSLAEVSEEGVPSVRRPGSDEAIPARFIAPVDTFSLRAGAERNAEVLVMFERGDPNRPIIIGIVQPFGEEVVRVDGKRLAIEGQDEVVISCGEASITLRRNGKVVIKGNFVESHSRGVQRLVGAAVKIN